MNNRGEGVLEHLREVDIHARGGFIKPFGNSESLLDRLRAVTLDIFQGITGNEVHELTISQGKRRRIRSAGECMTFALEVVDGIGEHILCHVNGVREIIATGIAAFKIREVNGISTILFWSEDGWISIFVHVTSPFRNHNNTHKHVSKATKRRREQ